MSDCFVAPQAQSSASASIRLHSVRVLTGSLSLHILRPQKYTNIVNTDKICKSREYDTALPMAQHPGDHYNTRRLAFPLNKQMLPCRLCYDSAKATAPIFWMLSGPRNLSPVSSGHSPGGAHKPSEDNRRELPGGARGRLWEHQLLPSVCSCSESRCTPDVLCSQVPWTMQA